jgi:hypothetical protein
LSWLHPLRSWSLRQTRGGSYFLKNRIYIGEIHHRGKWFKGEHEAILDRSTFDSVQELLKSNVVKRKVKFSQSGSLLQGKIFDDKGHRMGPSFSSKNGMRYRFYISTALRGRKHKAGTITRISAPGRKSRENRDRETGRCPA